MLLDFIQPGDFRLIKEALKSGSSVFNSLLKYRIINFSDPF